jgi:hypothetical protein
MSPQRFNMFLLARSRRLRCLLGRVGIYSVLAYSVRQRSREIRLCAWPRRAHGRRASPRGRRRHEADLSFG